MKVYCLSIYNENIELFKKLKLIPVGLGNAIFNNQWLTDKNIINISKKNSFYGEYTFHYNIWKNKIINNNYSGWIGFCTYRRFWIEKPFKTINNYADLQKNILKNVPNEWQKYECILAEPIKIGRPKKIKIIKNALNEIISNPYLLFKKQINIKDHFDICHGSYFINESIKLLQNKEKNDFLSFLNNTSFNPYNMFICKNYKILKEYYSSVFDWLKLCEEKFGFEGLNGYGKRRIYGFLAERYLSFWFNKYTKSRSWPIAYFDTHKHDK
jgi:hypothetical protein